MSGRIGIRRSSLFLVPVSGCPHTMICFRCQSMSSQVSFRPSTQAAIGKEFNHVRHTFPPNATTFAKVFHQSPEVRRLWQLKFLLFHPHALQPRLGFSQRCPSILVMRSNSGLEDLSEGCDSVVVVMAGDLLAGFRCPFLASLRGDLVKAKPPKLRLGGLNLLLAQPPVFLASRFDRRVALQVAFEKNHCFAESRRVHSATRFLVPFQKIG